MNIKILSFISCLSYLQVTKSQFSKLENAYKKGPDHLLRNVKDEFEYPDYTLKSSFRWNNSPDYRQNVFGNLPKTGLQANDERSAPIEDLRYVAVMGWPDPHKKLGQLSAVSLDKDGNVVVFHRGDRIWNEQTFYRNNIYAGDIHKPITMNTLIVFNATDGAVLQEWGSNMFFLPHGLTIDNENNIWVTDVALHQVFKFTPSKLRELTLGQAFIPANDNSHFCKPTSVAVLNNGDFFVADGYCNSRIMKFDKKGMLLMSWGRNSYHDMTAGKNSFSVPHGLATDGKQEKLFVADRENGRIMCYNTTTGDFLQMFQSSKLGDRLFSVAYSPSGGGTLYTVNGPSMTNPSPVIVSVISLTTNSLVDQFNAPGTGLQNPHDIAVSFDGSQVYVVELNPYSVWKFVKGSGINVTSFNLIKPKTDLKATVLNSSQSSVKVQDGIQMQALSSEHSIESVGSIIAVVSIIVGVVVVSSIIIAAVCMQMRKRGCLLGYRRTKRWEFPNSSAEGFKLGQFLERRPGFEKVCTDESDEEGSGSSNCEMSIQNNELA